MFSLGTIGVLGIILAVVLLFVFIAKRYRIAKPDEAVIVTGGRGRKEGGKDGDLSSQKVVTGGGVFVLPFIQKSFTLSLKSRQLSLRTEAQTHDGITIQAEAVAVVKVGGTNELIRAAAQRFLSEPEAIDISTQEVLSGSLRAIIGTLTLENIMTERATVAQTVLEAVEEALTKQGLVVDTLQIQSVKDNSGALENRGRPHAAKLKQLAEISEIQAEREAAEERISAEQIILEKQRVLKNKEAEVKKETDKVIAEAAAAQPLEEARQKQLIAEQNQILAQKEVAVREQQLNSEVRVVADANAYETEKTAEASAHAEIQRANAERDARFASAQADQAEGLAKAEALRAIGIAEAEAIEARGAALEEQSAQILAQQLIESFPLMMEKYALALGGIEHMTVVSADGTSAVAGESIGAMKAMMEMTKETLGIDVPSIVNNAVAGGAAGAAAARESKETRNNRAAGTAAANKARRDADTIQIEPQVSITSDRD